MTQATKRSPVSTGDQAPNFSVPAITRDGDIRLADYQGQQPLLLGLFRGVYCPFCRRQMAMLDGVGQELAKHGFDTLAIVTTPVERAKRYFRYRPTKMKLGSNPDMSVHQSFGLPASQITKEPMQWPRTINLEEFSKVRVNPFGELDKQVSVEEAGKILDAKDNFIFEKEDDEDAAATWNQLCGLFLLDKSANVRWSHVEAADSPDGFASYADKREILDAAEGIVA
jgi:peroxiredoxin